MNLPKNLRVLLVEDNPGFSSLLQLLLHELGLSNIMIASNFEQGWEFFDSAGADICILDIDLGPGQKSGIHLAEKIRTQDQLIPIIYLTANYTEDSYESSRHTRPSNFLNKEISRFKIQQALDLALLHHETLPIQKNVPPLVPPLITGNQFFFKIGDIYKAIPVKDVAYFFADHRLTYAKVGQRNYPTNVQLKTLEEEFFHIFARSHKTYLVNINLIESIQPKDNTLIIGGDTLSIGYSYRKNFLERLNLLR